MKSRTSISKIKEGSNHSTGRFVITRNKIQVKRNSKRRLEQFGKHIKCDRNDF